MPKCSKCGSDLKENENFCNQCGTKIDNKKFNTKPKHWIQNTKIGIYFSNHETARKILASISVIISFILAINALSSMLDINIQKGIYEYTRSETARIAILEHRIKIYTSIILIPLILYYTSKLTEKRE